MRTRRLLPLLVSTAALLACPTAASASVTEFSANLSHDSAPADITAGPDGNLWFTAKEAVGTITVSGVITEYPAGSVPGFVAGRQPQQVTAGPNASLWFTVQGNKQRIARLNPATGSVAEFKLASDRKPSAITAGPDGNVWFTESGVRKIGRITPAGTITEYSAGLGSHDVLNDIADGHDGGLWFTVAGSVPRIGRIDATTGLLQHFTSGLAGSAPGKLTAASDGRLYFTDSAAPGAIRRITTAARSRPIAAG